MNVHDLSAFLRPHCAIDEQEGPRYARARIGTVKRSAPIWKFKPLFLAGEQPANMAAEILDRLQTERGKLPIKAWIEVVSQGDTHATACSAPIALDPAEGEGEVEPDDDMGAALRRGDPAAMVACAVNAVIETMRETRINAEMNLRDKSADLAVAHDHVLFLQGQLFQTLRENADLAGKANAIASVEEGGAMSAAIGGFTGKLAEILGPRLEILLDQATPAASAAAAEAPKPAAASTETAPVPVAPDARIDGLLSELGAIMAGSPEAVMERHWTAVKAAYGQLKYLAGMRGWAV
jgi:hypothetical protein